MKNKKYILLGDTHIGVNNDSEVFLNYQKDFFSQMFAYMMDNHIDTIIQFGDLVDKRRSISYISLKYLKEMFFDKIREYGFHIIILVGNHDCPYKNKTKFLNAIHSLLIEYDDIVQIIEDPMEIDLDGVDVAVIPWISAENVDATNQLINNSSASYCFGHFEFNGFLMQRGIYCEDGMNTKIFEKFKHVYSGHFHIKSTRKNITYLGTPYQLTWNDVGDTKGFYTFIPATGQLEFIENKSPIYMNIYINDENDYDIAAKNEYNKSLYVKLYDYVGNDNKNTLLVQALVMKGLDVNNIPIPKDIQSIEDRVDVEDLNHIFVKVTNGDKELNDFMISLHNEAISID